jgi:hypothetical protein
MIPRAGSEGRGKTKGISNYELASLEDTSGGSVIFRIMRNSQNMDSQVFRNYSAAY